MENINDIFNNHSENDFKDLNLKEINLIHYDKIMNEKIKSIYNNFEFQKCTTFIKFITEFIAQREEDKLNIQQIHYDLLLKFLSFDSHNIDKRLSGNEILPFLISCISLEQINHYDEFKKTSIFKKILLLSSNIEFLKLFMDNGLICTSVEGLNPYYYSLINSDNSNVTIQILEKMNLPLPENYWRYNFLAIADQTISKEKNYLLSLPNKQFIINDITQESIWTTILEKNELIEFIPDEFYKYHKDKTEQDTLVKKLIKYPNIDFIAHIQEKILKLVENESDLYDVWDECLLHEGSFRSLTYHYYGSFKEVITSSEYPEFTEAKKNFEEIDILKKEHLLTKIVGELISYKYLSNYLTTPEINFEYYEDMNSLISDYRILSPTSPIIAKLCDEYFNKLPNFSINEKNQKHSVIDQYYYDHRFISSTYYYQTPVKWFSEHLKKYFSQLDSDKKTLFNKKIIESHLRLLSCITPSPKEAVEKIMREHKKNDDDDDNEYYENENIETEKNLETEKDLEVNLFTDESIKNFKRDYTDSTNENMREMVKNFNKKILPNQRKKLAKASVLLAELDKLYETFPHFETVIKHIENLMLLQEKGDKSFFIPPLLLGGGPGVGKTFFCNTISKLVNTRFEMLNMESVSANFVLTGGSSQWAHGETGRIYNTLMHEDNETLNPIILLDELEKAGGDSRYGVMNALLPLLERFTAKKFKDECIPLEIDASYIIWLATANDLDKLSAPIKSRFDIFSIPSPSPIQRKSLIRGIYKAVREGNTWGHHFDETLPEESLDLLSNLMTPGAARDLRKSITMAFSKAIRTDSKILLPEHIERYENGETMPWDIML